MSVQIKFSTELIQPEAYQYEHIIIGKKQGPVVQSIISLTSSLRVISLTVLVDSIDNILIFLC